MGPERFRSGQARRAPGWTLPELLMAVGLVLALAAWVSRGEAEARARQSLQAASQRVVGGLEALMACGQDWFLTVSMLAAAAVAVVVLVLEVAGQGGGELYG